MWPRFLGHDIDGKKKFGPADMVSLVNAIIGLAAISFALVDPLLSCRLILLSALVDGVDGMIARQFGGSSIGPHIDSISDIVSFGVAPSLVIYSVVTQTNPISFSDLSLFSYNHVLIIFCILAFFSMSAIRLSLYMAYDIEHNHTIGAQTPVAAIIVSSVILVQTFSAISILLLTLVLAYLMVIPIKYPDLFFRDAILLSIVQLLTIAFPDAIGHAFPYALLILSLAYLFLSPSHYWNNFSERI
jgi:CDP-diacylglycerol--serine O-phosphatidyltransferase